MADLRTEHTPGPWTVETIPNDHGGRYITGHVISPLHTYVGNKSPYCRADSVTDVNSMTCADAHLISAAPDYHDAFSEAMLQAQEEDKFVAIPKGVWNALLAAHAKAIGGGEEES